MGNEVTTTPEQQEAAVTTVNLERQINRFISESKRVAIINYILTGIIIFLTIINVAVAIAEKGF